MGLSKDDLDNTKETQRPEVNKRTQKRRLRRKKLHAAKEDIINTNTQINVNKNIANINLTVCTDPKSVSEIPVSQPNQCNKKVSDKIQKFSCPVLDKVKSTESSSLDSNQKDLKSSPVNQISNIESQNQNTKPENKETQPKSSDANDNNKCKCESNKKQKSKSKNLTFTENQKTQSDNSIQIENQKLISENPLLSRNQQTAKFENIILTENKETKFEKPLFQNLESSLEKPTLAKNQKEEKKPSLIENQKTRVEKPGLTNNYKTKSDISILSQNQVNNIGVLNDKKTHNSIAPLNQNTDTITDSTTVNKGKKFKLDPVVSIENYNPGTEYNISVIEQISKSSVQEMGKSQDSTDLQKQPESKSKDLKTDDTTVNDGAAKSREDVKAAREAKKLAKQKAKKKNDASGDSVTMDKDESKASKASETKVSVVEMAEIPNKSTATVQDTQLKSKTKESFVPAAEKVVVTKLEKGNVKADIKSEADGIEGTTEKTEDGNGKSKAELRAERRAKQEAQRAAKQAAVQAKVPKPAPKAEVKEEAVKTKEEKPVKAKSVEKTKPKAQSIQRVGWFWNHLNTESDKASLKNIPINSNLHPAVIKLGVQLASHVVTGSNARCIALLDALKKMVRDYSLPARTEFARGLEAQLTASVDFLASMRTPTASETNALKHFRRQLTQLPNNVDEFDAKKKLQEEIDRYIREQIDMAGEAISIIMRKKICDGDNILTYGCSSLIERILCEAWAAGVRFRATVVGARVNSGAREMLRRLLAAGLPAAYVDISALGCVMSHVSKVVLGAGALLANGAVVGAAGGAALALVARARNVPVLVACETHKFSERLRTDAFLYDEIGDPDDLIDKTDENSPLKDWRSNPNLNLLNLTYDVTPPSLITAVVTELGILPCTSAPVVLRFKLSEYGI